MPEPIDIETRLDEALQSLDECYLFDLQYFREDILDVSPKRFVNMLNSVGADASESKLNKWERREAVPDWRNRIAIQRLWKLAKKVMKERKAKLETAKMEQVERSLTAGIIRRHVRDQTAG